MKKYKVRMRQLTPREVGRLMGVDEESIEQMLNCGFKDAELYKMYANSIVVDCMVHIFDNLFLNRPERKIEVLW